MLELLKSKILVSDGAIGTELLKLSSEYQVGTEFKVILPLDSGHNCLKKEEVKKYEVI